jgi:hypothetical protein
VQRMLHGQEEVVQRMLHTQEPQMEQETTISAKRARSFESFLDLPTKRSRALSPETKVRQKWAGAQEAGDNANGHAAWYIQHVKHSM